MSAYSELDDWIQRRPADVFGLTTDDAGLCPNCGQHIDSGRCECTEEEQEEAASK